MKKGYPLPEGAHSPAGGYAAGWGPPFATPRDCPAPDWNHLCPWGGPEGGTTCAVGCFGLSVHHAQGRNPRESEHAFMLRIAGRRSQPAPQKAYHVDAELEAQVRAVRAKRGRLSAHRLLVRNGMSDEEATAYLAATGRGAYAAAAPGKGDD